MKTNLTQQFSKHDLDILQEDILYQGFFKLKKIHFRHKLFNGGLSKVVTRELLEKHDAVALVAYDPKLDKVILVEQVRIAAYSKDTTQNPWLLELIAGIIDKDKTPAEIVLQEAKEEANIIDIENLDHVLSFLESPGGTKEKIYLFVGQVDASQASGVFGLISENEDIKVHVLDRQQAYQLVLDGTIYNSIAVIGLLWLELHYLDLQDKWLK